MTTWFRRSSAFDRRRALPARRSFLGKPYSGAPCHEGRVGCYVWIQEGVVVGRASRCMN